MSNQSEGQSKEPWHKRVEPKSIYQEIRGAIQYTGPNDIVNILSIEVLKTELKKRKPEVKFEYEGAYRHLSMSKHKWAILDAVCLAYFDKIIKCIIKHENKLPDNFPDQLKKLISQAISNAKAKKQNCTGILNKVFKPLVSAYEYYSTEDIIIYLYKELGERLSDEEKKSLKLDEKEIENVVKTQLNLLKKFSEVLKYRIELHYLEDKEIKKRDYGEGEDCIRVFMIKENLLQLYILYDEEERKVYF